jgi:glycosyltransferase involved in cell wall biosynthesis
VKLVYPLLWSRPGRQADREQAVNTAAGLARAGHAVTLIMPRGGGDPALCPDDLRRYFNVEGDFGLVQRPSRWAGESVLPATLWLRQLVREPLVRAADVFYSRMPVTLGFGGWSPVPFATDLYRPWPDHFPPGRPFIRRTSRHARCLGFVVHSHFAAESYRRAGVAAEKLLVAHNGADPGRMLPRLAVGEARARVGLPADRPVALYAGRVNERKGLDQVLVVAARRPEWLFVLVGSEGEGEIERASAALGNVRIVPWATPERLPAWLYAADLLLIPPSRAPLERYGDCVLPMKTFSYLAAGRPILAPVSPDTAELLSDGENALLVAPDDPGAAAAAIDRLRSDPELATRLSAGAIATAADLSWDHRAARIAAFLEARLGA